jgi:hypothetical protein
VSDSADPPLELPIDVPVALRARQRLPLVAGRLATTAGLSPPRNVAAKLPTKAVVRVRRSHTEWVEERLSDRDRAIMAAVDQNRAMSGAQLERVYFADVSEPSRARARRRVLMPLDRRIGGHRSGSAALVFALDSAGQRLLHQAPARRAYTPKESTLKHTLAVSELYVDLVERSRLDGFELLTFTARADCWWPDGHGGKLEPDALARLATKTHVDVWWLERDMHTAVPRSDDEYRSEDLTTVSKTCRRYLDFVDRGQLGPYGVTPRVLWAVQNEARLAAIVQLVERLPEPASRLFHVKLADHAAGYMVSVLRA